MLSDKELEELDNYISLLPSATRYYGELISEIRDRRKMDVSATIERLKKWLRAGGDNFECNADIHFCREGWHCNLYQDSGGHADIAASVMDLASMSGPAAAFGDAIERALDLVEKLEGQ